MNENPPQAAQKTELAARISRLKPRRDFLDHTYISLRHKYVFHTVGKAANSTVKQYFYALELKGSHFAMPSVHDRGSSPLLSPFQLDRQTLEKALTGKEFLRFTFVRDPYARLLSCFLDRIKDHKSRPYRELMRWVKKDVGYKPEFGEFIKAICEQTPFQQNNHWRLQYADAMMPEVGYDFIGKQESFSADMSTLMSRITGAPVDLQTDRVNASPSVTAAHDKLPKYWTAELVQMVQTAFAKDFETFGYEPEREWMGGFKPTVQAAGKPPAKKTEQTQPVRRHIRLKEFSPLVQRSMSPTEDYLSQTNGTLPPGNYKLTANADGFLIDPKHAKRPGPKLFVLGDSFVECSFIHEGSRFCDVLNQKLGPAPGVCFNAGYSGATSLNLYNVLINKIVDKDPHSVLFVLPSNDPLSLLNGNGYWNLNDRRYAPVLPVRRGPPAVGEFEQNAGQLAPLLETMCGLSDAFGFNLHLATTPFVSTQYEELAWFRRRHKTRETYEGLMERRRVLNQVVRNTAQKCRKDLIDLEAILTDTEMFYDDVHVNEQGSLHLADILMQRLGWPSTAGT